MGTTSGRPYVLPTRVADQVWRHKQADFRVYIFFEQVETPGFPVRSQIQYFTVGDDQTVARSLLSESSYQSIRMLMANDPNWIDLPCAALPV